MLQVRILGQFDVRSDGKRVNIPSRAAQSLFALLILTAGTKHRREKLAGQFWPDSAEENARGNLRRELWRLRKALAGTNTSEYLLAEELTVSFDPHSEYWLDVAQLEQDLPPESELQARINQTAVYQGELLPGFYEDWVMLERERLKALYERKIEALIERLVAEERWTSVAEWSNKWLSLDPTAEQAYRALMLAYGARGDMARAASLYQRCIQVLREELGVEPSAETRALYEGLVKGARLPRPVTPVQPAGPVTFLFSDIEGSTRLLERLGEQYGQVLVEQREVMRAVFKKWNGHEMDAQGDSFFVVFTSATNAALCALEAQRALLAHAWPGDEKVRVRMGLHTGEAVVAGTGYVGLDVHRAARIGDAGHGGQVLVSQSTRDLLAHDLPERVSIRDLGEHQLKDMHYQTRVYQLVSPDLPADFPPLRILFSTAQAPAPGESPFKGLEYFDVQDADLFFGRELLTAELVDKLRESTFLSVVGASGSGKSSIVRAGVVPELKKGELLADGTAMPAESVNWDWFILTPTAHPLLACATTLARHAKEATATATLADNLASDPQGLARFLSGHRHTLLVVDQFEELFTLCHDEFEREAFIDNLLAASTHGGPVTLIITVRADFYAHLAEYPELREAVSKQQVYIGPMASGELRRAIEEPARRSHWEFELGLVDLILRDVGDEPGALPLLSHALLETWKRRSGRTLTLKGYADCGGVRGAIAQTAETTFQQLDPEQQLTARDIFLRLTELGEGTEDTRRRASFHELYPSPERQALVKAVLQMLVEARLITTGHDSVQVAHEALIREWIRLREWLNADREGLRLHRQLTEAAREWALLDREQGSLFRGARLAQAREWAATNGGRINEMERAFLQASEEHADREVTERQAQQQRELAAAQKLAEEQARRATEQSRAARELRRRARYLAGALLLALVLAGIALVLGQQANTSAAAARDSATLASHNQATAVANAAAAQRAQTDALAQRDAADRAREEADAQHLSADRESRIATGRELSAYANNNLDVDPERSILLSLAAIRATAPDRRVLPEAEAALHRAVLSSRIQKSVAAHEGGISTLSYSPDGTRLATGGEDKKVRVWDTTTFSAVLTIDAHDEMVDSLAYSPDGKQIATSSDDKTAKLWDAATGRLLLTLKGHGDWVTSVVFRPDGRQLATMSGDKTLRFWNAATGQQETSRPLQDPGPLLAYSPDGSRLYFVDAGQLHAVSVKDGKEIYALKVADYVLAVSPDGKQLAVILPDSISVRDAADGRLLYNIAPPSNRVEQLAFTPDSSRLAGAGRDSKIHLWDATTGIELFTLSGHTSFVASLAFSPDGRRIASGDFGGTFKVWSLEPRHEMLSIAASTNRLALSPDGKRVAVTGDSFQVWDSTSGKLVFEHKPGETKAFSVAYSPDGREIMTGGNDGRVQVWDAGNGVSLQTIETEGKRISAVTYRPDGQAIAVVGLSGKVYLYAREGGKSLGTWNLDLGQLTGVAFSPDGARLAITSSDAQEVRVIDAATGNTLLTLKGHASSTTDLTYDRTGTRIVTSGRDGTARIWDAASGQLLATLSGHTSTVTAARLTPDGTRVVTGSKDGTVRIWDAATGQELLAVETGGGQDGGIISLALSPDGKHVFAGDFGTVKQITLAIDELVQIARTRLTRTWTQDECSKFLHTSQCPVP